MSVDEQRADAQGQAAEESKSAEAESNSAEDASATRASRSPASIFRILIPVVIVLDILAFIFVPPYPKGAPGTSVSGIGDLIGANLELPAPHVVLDLAPNDPVSPTAILFVHPSISAPILTTWIVAAVLLAVLFLASRGMTLVPNPVQNAVEFAWEALENWAVSLGGEDARRHVPLFSAFFLFILFSNWSGLLPFVGKIEDLRAPTSDVNVTIGLALIVFVYFQFQGFRALGVRGYLGKFFAFGAFRDGLAAGFIAIYVGLIEFLLEFIKPVTLAMRLFGNIFGGEVAIGVLTALTIAIIPVGMLGLELLLNFVQALIFSTLMLMYTILAVESHDEKDHEEGARSERTEVRPGAPIAGAQPAA